MNRCLLLVLAVYWCIAARGQAACASGRSILSVTANQSIYCPGDLIDFVLTPVNPSTISGSLTWKYTGAASATIVSGAQNKQFDLKGVSLSGVVTVTGTLVNPTTCKLTQTFNVNVAASVPTANAGPDLFYAGIPVAFPASCATGGNGVYTIQWSPSTGLSNATTCGSTASPATTTTYFLQVTDGNNCVGTDQVNVINVASTISYAVPKKTLDGGYYKPNSGKVYFRFEEEYRTGTLSCNIIDYSIAPSTISCALSPSGTKQLGDNRYYIDISACSLPTSKYYVVELTNDKNEKFYFKFLN